MTTLMLMTWGFHTLLQRKMNSEDGREGEEKQKGSIHIRKMLGREREARIKTGVWHEKQT